MLMSQMHDLSFMLESNLSFPPKWDAPTLFSHNSCSVILRLDTKIKFVICNTCSSPFPVSVFFNEKAGGGHGFP
jgi:hypothetical protein